MVEALYELAARQHGLLTYGQAREHGLSKEAILHRVRRGEWIRLRTGLYALSGSPPSWFRDVMAAVLAAEVGWASHATSARLFEYTAFDDEPIEISVLLERRPRLAGVRVHRTGTLTERDLREVNGIPTLSAARTIADLSMRLDAVSLARMVDDGLRRGVLTLSGINRVVRHLHQKAPGRSPKKLAVVLADRLPGYNPGGSDLETRVFDCLVSGGLPAPVRQHKVFVSGRTYYLDLAYPGSKLDIEVDGFEFHRGRGAFDADRIRQNDLVAAGWTVLRFTSTSMAQEIVAAVRDALFGRSVGL